MENNFLKNLYAAIDVYYGYIKIAQETGEKIVPFDHLMQIGERLAGIRSYPYLNLITRMDKEYNYINQYNRLKEKYKDLDDKNIINVAFKLWVEYCFENNIISQVEQDDLLKLLEDLKKPISESEVKELFSNELT
jgi:hypothetical protein